MIKNSPNINLKYNYVYKTTNLVNNKIYIGVHRTNKLNDNYLGSGNLIRRAIFKYGVHNFKREILKFFNTYKEALDYERELVTAQFIERIDTYNLYEGGYGSCKRSALSRKLLSNIMRLKWLNDDEFRDKMLKVIRSESRRQKIGSLVKEWIKSNPELHTERMNKINTNPLKIKKTAEWHRGKTRSSSAKRNIRNGMIKAKQLNPDITSIISGKGKRYIYNPELKITMRVHKEAPIPDGWVVGSGPKKKKDGYKNLNKGSVFAYEPNTGKIKRFRCVKEIPTNYIIGRPKQEK